MALNPNFGRLYEADPTLSRVQDNVQAVLGPLALAVQNTPIMGAPPPARILMQVLGGFVNLGGVWAPCSYCKDCLGYVHLQGVVTNPGGGAIAAGTPILVLPIGFRPSHSNSYAVSGAPGAVNSVTIDNQGNVSCDSNVPNGGHLHLHKIFLGEN